MRFTLIIMMCFAAMSLSMAQTKDITNLTDSIAKILEKDHIPGLMLALVHRDSVIWAGGVGLADRENNRPVTNTDLFRIGSISKTFTSLAVHRLMAEGKFSLDSKLKDIAPEVPFENPWEFESPVRVVNLLEHTAGFDDIHFKDFVNLTGVKRPTLDEVLVHRKTLVSRWKPGTRMSYSNPGYVILGFLIEKYSGMPFEDYVRQTVIDPLKMVHTNFDFTTEPPYARGYSYDNGWHDADPVMINGRAAGAISSCSADMAIFVRMLLNNGKLDSVTIVPESTLRDMERQHSTLAAAHGLTSGYGLAIYTKLHGQSKNRKIFHGHNGGIMGFSSDMGYSTERGVGYILSNNGEGSNRKITSLVAEFLFGGDTLSLPPAAKLNSEQIEPWLGTYIDRAPRNEITTFVDDLMATQTLYIEHDTLFARPFLDTPKALIPVSDVQFRNEGDPIATTILMEKDGERVALVDQDYLEKISPIRLYSNRIFIFTAVVSGILSILAILAWIVLFLMKRISPAEALRRSTGGLAMVSLLVLVFTCIALFDLKNIPKSAFINGMTITIFIGSVLFPLLSVMALYFVIRARDMNRFIFWFQAVTAFCLCYLAVYMATYGWFAMRIWTY